MYSRKEIVEYFIYFGSSFCFCWALFSSFSSISISVSLKSEFIVVIYPFCTRHIQTIQYILFSFVAFSNNHDMTWREGRFYFIALPAPNYTTIGFCDPDFPKMYADATTTTMIEFETSEGSREDGDGKEQHQAQERGRGGQTKGLHRIRYMW